MAHNKEPPPQEEISKPPAPKEAPPAPAPTTVAPPPPTPPVQLAPPEPDHTVVEPQREAPAGGRMRRGFVGASVVVGSALDRGSPRLGGELTGHLLLGAGIYAHAGAAYSASLARVDGVETTFAEAFLGLSYARELGASFTSVFHAEAVGERFSPSIENSGGGPSSGERWLGGAQGSAPTCITGERTDRIVPRGRREVDGRHTDVARRATTSAGTRVRVCRPHGRRAGLSLSERSRDVTAPCRSATGSATRWARVGER